MLEAEVSEVLSGARPWAVVRSDCLDFLAALPEGCASLVMGSPPYCDARTYGIDAVCDCVGWLDWMLRVTEAAVRVSSGLVLWVAAGVQRGGVYWPACEGLMWEWYRRGNHLWCPAVWWKVDEAEGGTGIPGSGGNVPGKRWLRKDWEYVLAFKGAGPLPFDHPELMGHEPVYSRVGGAMSNRTQDGRRINEAVGQRLTDGRLEGWADDDPWKTANRGGKGCGGRRKNGKKMAGPTRRKGGEYKHVARDDGPLMPPGPVHDGDGNLVRAAGRPFPKLANPGNVLPLVVKARVGGGHMGAKLCHENEAPYPEALCDFFIRAYSPPGGLVIDPFAGSGTTLAVAHRLRRRSLGCDLRQSQVDLSRKRVAAETPLLCGYGEDKAQEAPGDD